MEPLILISKIMGLLLASLLVACATAAPQDADGELPERAEPAEQVPEDRQNESPAAAEPAVETERDEPTPDRSRRLTPTPVPKPLERVPTPEAGEAVVGEVPEELLALILADLAGRLATSPETIEILRAEEAIWPDGALGCPKPGEVYTQAPVNGYWLQLAYAGITYDYRANQQGFYFLCESPLPGPSGAPTG